MRLLQKARQRIQEFIATVKRPDRALIAHIIPRKRPSLAQIQHVDLFLDTWEKNLIGAFGFIALISIMGIFWSVRLLNTVPGPATGGYFQEVLVGSPRHINPIFATSDTDKTLTNIVFLPLCDSFNRDIPTIAASCEFNDQKSVTITLADRTWHDGERITADDVIFTIQTMQNSAVGSPWRALAARVTAAKDAQGRVIITAKQSTPEFLTIASIGIIPKHLWEPIEPAKMMRSELNLKPIGSGAFAYNTAIIDRDSFVESIDFDVFSDFKPHRAYLDELEFRIAPDDATAYDLFKTRQVDAFFVHDPAQTAELVKRDVNRYEITPPIIVSLFFNPSHTAVFKKREVRQAFALAIDRATLVKEVLGGNGIPTRSPLPPSTLKNQKYIQPDLAAAEALQLFKKNKVGGTSSTPYILGVPALPTFQALAENIKNQLAPLGITITPALIGSGTKTGALLSYDLLILGQDYGMSGNAYPYWHTSASSESGTNYARYQIKEVDSWLDQLQVETRPENRQNLLEKLSQRLVNDSPALFLYQPTYQYYVSNKVHGIEIPSTIDASDRFLHSENWYRATTRVPR